MTGRDDSPVSPKDGPSQVVIYLGLVHTMPDKFERATLRAKTQQMFSVHT